MTVLEGEEHQSAPAAPLARWTRLVFVPAVLCMTGLYQYHAARAAQRVADECNRHPPSRMIQSYWPGSAHMCPHSWFLRRWTHVSPHPIRHLGRLSRVRGAAGGRTQHTDAQTTPRATSVHSSSPPLALLGAVLAMRANS